ncbi:hypothetical protein CETAM_08880 [Corynebacterium comes]|uniref:Uncharacterized protein n=1 Tax=Corynebacterium comes TaxID=2675218 RepID=A0A6B8W565_9CORY|nr:hypothetical protein CETAM_08880 [Corynebacterium comes]
MTELKIKPNPFNGNRGTDQLHLGYILRKSVPHQGVGRGAGEGSFRTSQPDS